MKKFIPILIPLFLLSCNYQNDSSSPRKGGSSRSRLNFSIPLVLPASFDSKEVMPETVKKAAIKKRITLPSLPAWDLLSQEELIDGMVNPGYKQNLLPEEPVAG
jgi:hypothetical protein